MTLYYGRSTKDPRDPFQVLADSARLAAESLMKNYTNGTDLEIWTEEGWKNGEEPVAVMTVIDDGNQLCVTDELGF